MIAFRMFMVSWNMVPSGSSLVFLSLFFFLFTLILSVFPGALNKERERERQDKLCLYIILK